MLPAYFTALGTQSSAATIPVTLEQTKKNGVSAEVAGFVIPLCATIHLSGSTLKIVACALALKNSQRGHDSSARNSRSGYHCDAQHEDKSGTGFDDCALHRNGQFRHSLQRNGRRSYRFDYRQNNGEKPC